MSALALNRCEATIRSCAATLLHASYTDGIPTETTDVWRTIAADAARDLTALITRLRAAEARTAWQPIETAPLDETRVLLWLEGDGVNDARHPLPWEPLNVGIARFDRVTNYWFRDDGDVLARRPLAWQPLPAAPEAP